VRFRVHKLRDERVSQQSNELKLIHCINHICARASDKCLREKRKTINGDDLLWAMSTLGFEEYIEPLKLHLVKFRQVRSLFEYFVRDCQTSSTE